MAETFSDRHGYRVHDAEITVREDAPEALRHAVLLIAQKVGMTPTVMREIVCGVLLVRPDPGNWSDYPNVWDEVNYLTAECDWFQVYDIVEELHAALASDPDRAEEFADRLNQFFRKNGIGWELLDSCIVFRGSEAFAESTRDAVTALTETGRPTAASEIREALQDISRRPQPDITGAIQHVMAGLESASRSVAGQANRTLGQLVPELDLPRPLDTAVEKLWGYASDRARHIREGQTVDTAEAELVVSVACAVCTFLIRRSNRDNPELD